MIDLDGLDFPELFGVRGAQRGRRPVPIARDPAALVSTRSAVDRVLAATGWQDQLPVFGDVWAAVDTDNTPVPRPASTAPSKRDRQFLLQAIQRLGSLVSGLAAGGLYGDHDEDNRQGALADRRVDGQRGFPGSARGFPVPQLGSVRFLFDEARWDWSPTVAHIHGLPTGNDGTRYRAAVEPHPSR